MAITDRFVLPADAVLQAASEFPDELRRRIAADEGDFVLSRPASRSFAKVIDSESAALIRQFGKPGTIAQAVARYSCGKAQPAEQLLEASLPLFYSLISEGLLVVAGSIEAEKIQPSLGVETRVDGWTVVRCVQALEDSEVYQARSSNGQLAAIKIGHLGNRFVPDALAREADVLRRLDSTVTPAVLGGSEWNGRPYLALEWIAGAEAGSACTQLRRLKDADSLASLMRITGAILNAYAHLHEQGIVHADVHLRNVLIDRNEAVRVIDFGLARRIGQDALGNHGLRGGVSEFFEPEFARAELEGLPAVAATFAGEQYALAALLHFLLTGYHYLDFSLEKNEMLRQIAEAPMIPFAMRGIEPWPDIEMLLSRALKKDATARFASVSEFARDWHAVERRKPVERASGGVVGRPRRMQKELLATIGLGGSLVNGESLHAPTTSLNYGSAGIAYAVYRMACATDDAELLALADVWIDRAIKEEANKNAFYSEEIEITPETVGKSSLYHSAAGVRVVQALLAQARGDIPVQCAATEGFIEVSQDPSPLFDVTLGRAGTLLGCVFLLDAFRGLEATIPVPNQKIKLRHFGDQIVAQLWQMIDKHPAIGMSEEMSNLGIAHGWAGLLYATLCWSAATAKAPPPSIKERLAQVAARGESAARGIRWKWHDAGTDIYIPGWCNGTAGFVFLWTAAHSVFGDAEYLQLAEGAAWHAWETPSSTGTLCCGAAGQAYALLNLYRHTGETIWLRRARQLASQAVEYAKEFGSTDQKDSRPLSLYKGHTGIALLELDLDCPLEARMPAFERETQDNVAV